MQGAEHEGNGVIEASSVVSACAGEEGPVLVLAPMNIRSDLERTSVRSLDDMASLNVRNRA